MTLNNHSTPLNKHSMTLNEYSVPLNEFFNVKHELKKYKIKALILYKRQLEHFFRMDNCTVLKIL